MQQSTRDFAPEKWCRRVFWAAFDLQFALFSRWRVRVVLAPMEGLLDDVLRGVLTRLGRYDWAVSEFVRVSGTLLPHRVYLRTSPELRDRSATASGTSVRIQLLGSDPVSMQENADHLVELSPAGIDLNFGCPAPIVNRHRGGAVLLDEPDLVHRIAAAVRKVVPPHIPFSAKMRIGVNDTARALDSARALADGGIDVLAVHARTKAQGYRPPAHWNWIARIAEAVPVPVIANGEVWCEADWRRCHAESGVAALMLGRGAVADPFLADRLRRSPETPEQGVDRDAEWRILGPAIGGFWAAVQLKVAPRHAPGRLKQWLNLLRRNYPQAQALFEAVRPAVAPQAVKALLSAHGIAAAQIETAGAGFS